jgi:hypothetical protein
MHGVAREVRCDVQGIFTSCGAWIVNEFKGNKRSGNGFGGGYHVQLKFSSLSIHCSSSSSCHSRLIERSLIVGSNKWYQSHG